MKRPFFTRGVANWMLLLAALAGMSGAPARAQVQTIDPDQAIDGDLSAGGELRPVAGDPYTTSESIPPPPEPYPVPDPAHQEYPSSAPYPSQDAYSVPQQGAAAEPAPVVATAPAQPATDTYQEDDLIGAAEGLFGKGAEGLAGLIRKILSEQGQPNAYVVGREAGAAIGVGLRYGSGTLHHKVEGERKVYWTGPSIGFDAGANAGSTFVLVYNLWDSQELYERYPAAEGQAYFVGGFNASYMRKGDVVIIPIRLGAGLRLGVNAGYMKFCERQGGCWFPF